MFKVLITSVLFEGYNGIAVTTSVVEFADVTQAEEAVRTVNGQSKLPTSASSTTIWRHAELLIGDHPTIQ